jgi:hypothetical protein
LLSRVKTTPLDLPLALRAAEKILGNAKAFRSGEIPDVVNVDFWFNPSVKNALGRLRRGIIESEMSPELRRFLLVALALTAERCSLRDARIPVPVRRKDWRLVASNQRAADVWRSFTAIAGVMADRLATIPSSAGIESVFDGEDAAKAGEIYKKDLADRLQRPTLILTSPPYGAAQKYIRSSSLALGWAGLAKAADLAGLERILIGREHFRLNELTALDTPNRSIGREISLLAARDKVRAAIYAHYFRSMEVVVDNLVSLLAPGGALVLVAGSNMVAGCEMKTHRHLKGLAVAHGMRPILELRDAIRGRVLLTKRARPDIPLKSETVHILRKPRQ